MKPSKGLPQLRLIACATALWALALCGNAAEVRGVVIPEKATPGAYNLVLNGTAVRSIWGFGIYVVALYLTETSRDEEAIMCHDQGEKRLHITMLRGVSARRFK
ncbi:MAG: chalcone isomerase family protein, partial [Verrucomicrobiales bacterium]